MNSRIDSFTRELVPALLLRTTHGLGGTRCTVGQCAASPRQRTKSVIPSPRQCRREHQCLEHATASIWINSVTVVCALCAHSGAFTPNRVRLPVQMQCLRSRTCCQLCKVGSIASMRASLDATNLDIAVAEDSTERCWRQICCRCAGACHICARLRKAQRLCMGLTKQADVSPRLTRRRPVNLKTD